MALWEQGKQSGLPIGTHWKTIAQESDRWLMTDTEGNEWETRDMGNTWTRVAEEAQNGSNAE